MPNRNYMGHGLQRRRTRRRVPNYTTKRIQRVAAVQDRREIQRLEGKWFGFNTAMTLTASTTGSVSGYLTLPRPPTMHITSASTKAYRGITIYGMNTLVSLAMVGTTAGQNQAPMIGALGASVARWDEDVASWPNLFPDQTEDPDGVGEDPSIWWNIRPWRWFQPWALNLAAGDPKHTIVQPFGFRRGVRVHLGPATKPVENNSLHDNYVLILGMPRNTARQVTLQWHGRYRYVEKEL